MNAIPPLPPNRRTVAPPLVLVAEPDERVLDLLRTALAAQHWRVVTAVDGDEAIRQARKERPDVAVLDVRMPRKDGFEVCDWLRHDPEDPQVPVVLVSAAADTAARVEGLARGADDFLARPFAPQELIARVKRLLVRAGEARAARRRSGELERELVRAQAEARRAQGEAKRELRLRELAFGAGRDLARVLDADDLAERVLELGHRSLGSGTLALLAPDPEHAGGDLVVQAVRGEPCGPCRGARLASGGELAQILAGLARPAPFAELERFAEARAELAPLAACGGALLAPLRSGSGLEAVLVADERPDGAAFAPADLEALGALCDFAAGALQNARRFRAAQDRALELLAERAVPRERDRLAAAEARACAERAARELELPVRERTLVRHAVALGSWGWSEPGRAALEHLRRDDPTRRLARLRALIEAGESLEAAPEAPPEERRAVLVTAACVRYAMMRASGRSPFESRTTALSWTGAELDAAVGVALERAFEDALQPAPTEPPADHAA